MYGIQKRVIKGLPVYELTFSGFIGKDEMLRWFEDSSFLLDDSPEAFGVKVDMRNLRPLTDEAQTIMRVGQKLYRESGMIRSAVLVDNRLLKSQFQRIARESGIHEWERYFSSEDCFHDRNMEAWLTEAVLATYP